MVLGETYPLPAGTAGTSRPASTISEASHLHQHRSRWCSTLRLLCHAALVDDECIILCRASDGAGLSMGLWGVPNQGSDQKRRSKLTTHTSKIIDLDNSTCLELCINNVSSDIYLPIYTHTYIYIHMQSLSMMHLQLEHQTSSPRRSGTSSSSSAEKTCTAAHNHRRRWRRMKLGLTAAISAISPVW